MKIDSIKLKNFRGYKIVDISLHGRSSVFYGINGVGKSSLLRAVDLIYANFIKRLSDAKKPLAELNEDDIYDSTQTAQIEIGFIFHDEKIINYRRSINRDGKKTHNKSELDELAAEFSRRYLGEIEYDDESDPIRISDSKPMPIFVNYGVNRTVLEPSINMSSKDYRKLDAFENAIDNRIDFKSFFSWFRQQEDIENEVIAFAKKNGMSISQRSSQLEAVRKAMLTMFPIFNSVRVDRQRNTFILNKGVDSLSINQLSDGEKCTIALFGDIARRMSIANKSSLNPLNGEGVVLIDEVDLHLHPQWQRKIVNMLRTTFPNVQFLLTTHSPQVLGEIPDDMNVLSIINSENGNQIRKRSSLWGWDSNIILEEEMDTSSVTEEIRKHMEEMYLSYEKGDLEKALSEADYIDKSTGGRNACVAGMRVLISRKRRK